MCAKKLKIMIFKIRNDKKINLIERNIMIAYALPGLGPVSMVCPPPLASAW